MMAALELRALLQERADYISHLEFRLMQKRFDCPEPQPYLLMPKEFYFERLKTLGVNDGFGLREDYQGL